MVHVIHHISYVVDLITDLTNSRYSSVHCARNCVVDSCPIIEVLLCVCVAKWLKHYDTSRKVAVSRPEEVNDTFFFQFA
jgi:hypothetical protein